MADIVFHHRDESVIVEVNAGNEDDIDIAVRAARRAFKGPWSKISGTERGELMRKLADLAEKATDTFASIDTWNNGTSPNTKSLYGSQS